MPERLRSIEIGAGYRFLQRNYINLALYYNNMSNLILEVASDDPNPSAPESFWNQNQNVGNARIYGSEITLDSHLFSNFNINIGYSYNKGEYPRVTSSPSTESRPTDNISLDYFNALTGSRVVPSSWPIPNIAPNKISVVTTYYPISNVSIYTGLNYIDVRRTIARNPVQSIHPYTMFKANIRWENFIMDGMFLLIMGQNLTNERFFDPGIRVADGNYYPTMHPIERRNIWITIGYSF
jgi:outer membrane receptor protein involved in Fe transport